MGALDGAAITAGDPRATGQTSATQQTSGSTERTYTEAELQKLVSDVKAEAGRERAALAKQLEAASATAAQLKATQEEVQRKAEERELDAVRGDPAALRAYQARREATTKLREVQEREAALVAREAAVTEKEALFTKQAYETAVTKLAAQYGVEEQRLRELGIEDAAKLEKVAAALGTKPPAPASIPVRVQRADSGKSIGGTNVAAMSPSEKIQYGLRMARK